MGEHKALQTKSGGVLNASSYVHLHNHTHHSLLDGLTKIPDLIGRVKELGMEAVAITDHGTMSGAIEFYKAAKDAGIKPIIGMEAYVAARSRFDRDPQKDKARYHLTVLAMNNQGYQNLMRLSSAANLEGMYYKPRIDHELLEKYNEGLIILSGCASSELGENLRGDNYNEALNIAKWYKSVFGDRYYLEIQDHGHKKSPSYWDVQGKINTHVMNIAKELDIPLVITSDGHYLDHDDQDAHEILLCVGTGAFLSDENRMSLKDFELHVTNPQDIIDRWQDTHSEAIANSKIIADRCDVELELGGIRIPVFPTPDGMNEKQLLDQLVYQGLAWRYGDAAQEEAEKLSVEQAKKITPKHVLERADYELSVIDRMDFNGYFLIVQDFINWGKNRGIVFGPGRGSAAGSIVAYATRITELDPLRYDLLFERFLNPDRISMPDVDIDIQDTRRDEVIAYCTEKYGEDRVANIVTFGRMAARAAVRDVARVLQVPYGESDRLAKLIPPPVQGRHIPLKKSIEEDAELRSEYNSNPTAKTVFDYAIRLEGTIRSHGVHAAGVVIAPDEVVKFTPVEMSQKGVVATQYPMGPIEDLGLLKMDFLGLSNLTIINNALRIIKKVYKKDIDLSTLPLDDKKTYALLQRGDTTGVFQLESAGMKRYLRELKPTVFEDIVAMCALYRPGPLGAGLTDSFVRRKNGKEPVTFEHELTKNALESTYGVIVYQEQVMQMSKEMSGFTGGEADTLRKGIGKKIPEVLQKMGDQFIQGAIKNGVPKNIVEKIWRDILGFADYAFNKSHSACYGLIAYWTAYLKAHYPDAFMAALMTSDQDDVERLAIEIAECRHMGIEVLAPDVNESYVEFAVVPGKNQIRFGMAAIKGLGVSAAEEILRAREAGKFESIEDFAKRVSTSKVNKRAWESLIKTGGFDAFGDRSDILFNLETITGFASKTQKEVASGQIDIFSTLGAESFAVQPSLGLAEAPVKHTEKERLTWERELLGLFVSAHPLDNYDTYFEEQTVPLSEITPKIENAAVVVGGLVTSVRSIVTKSGTRMAFVQLESKTGECEVVVFPNLYEQISEQLVQDSVFKFAGRVSSRDKSGQSNGDAKVIAEEAKLITDHELKTHKPSGIPYPVPTGPGPVTVTRSRNRQSSDGFNGSSAQVETSRLNGPPIITAPVELKTIYVHIKDPEDHVALEALKSTCSKHPGLSDIILVLGEEKKSAIKLPFKVDSSDELVGALVKLIGEDAVKLK